MQWLRVLGVLSCVSSLALGCAKGRDAKSASKDDKLAYDEKGQGKKCDTPKSNCDEVKDPSLDFKEKCREGGFRIKQCGCENLCSGNINADRTGYTNKNELKTCKDSADNKCESQETSAAYQDACEAVGGEMLECGCEWLCSKKLKEAIPDAPKEEEKKGDEAAGDEAKKPEEKKAAAGNMDGKSADEIAKDKAAKDKAAKDKAAEEKAAKDSKKNSSKSGSSSSSGSDKKKSRFFNDE